MKKVTIAILCLAVGALAIIGLTRSGVVDFSPSSSNEDSNYKTPKITCTNKKAIYYNSDLPSFQSSEGVPYEVTYSSPSLGIEKATTPNASGSWIANIKTLATPKYKESSSYYPFSWKATNANTLSVFDSINGTYSLINKDGYSYWEEEREPMESNEGYECNSINSHDASKKFSLWSSFKLDSDGDEFRFWLSDQKQDYVTTPDNYAGISVHTHQIELATETPTGANDGNYIQNEKLTDGYMHRFDIQIFSDKVEFSIDEKLVGTLTDCVPSMEQCYVHFDIIAAEQPLTMRFGQFEEE